MLQKSTTRSLRRSETIIPGSVAQIEDEILSRLRGDNVEKRRIEKCCSVRASAIMRTFLINKVFFMRGKVWMLLVSVIDIGAIAFVQQRANGQASRTEVPRFDPDPIWS